MITKNYKSIFSFVAALAIGFFMVSCDQEDDTGYSTMDPTSPSLDITVSETNVILVENDQIFEFTASLSEVQLVDVKLYAFQADGDADGDDFELTGTLVIPAGATSAKGTLKILKDDVIEETETLKIQIGNNKTANASKNSGFIDVTILNYEDGDLIIDMSWDMSLTTDDAGNELSPTDFADLRLLISENPNNIDVVGGADGGSFETYILSGDEPDGDYYVVADFYAASDIVRDIDLILELNQPGVITSMGLDYPAALSNLGTCDLNFYVMTKITKSGTSYTFEDVSTLSYEYSVYSPWDYGFDSVDAWSPAEGYPSHIMTKEICDGFYIKGLNAEWMPNSWGEEIQPNSEADVFAALAADGTFTIASQPIFTTLYDGSLYPYTVSGSGTYDSTTGEMHVEYYLDQDGFDVSDWMKTNGYMDTDYFEATVTVDAP